MTLLGPTSQSFISQRLRLHYVDWGNPGKPPLLMIHGGRDHCRNWDWVAEQLREDWHIIAIDHRGHGDSDWVSDGNYLISDMIYDVAQLVHQLDLAPVSILSHSMGGGVAMGFAGAFPDQVSKLVAIEPVGLSPEMEQGQDGKTYPERIADWVGRKRDAAARKVKSYPTIEAAQERMQAVNHFLTEEQARHLTLHGVNRNEDGSFSWKFDPHLHSWPVDATPREMREDMWRAITCPVLLLYGADSFATNPEKTDRLKFFQNARMIEFENAGHWLHHDQFDRFMVTLREFL
ncbi:MAG: alpha/beta hydrolase [Sphingomonadaceae bacterium]|nr:alpha/beta hydrolase [Sphingomonadaceae bacterium]